MPDGPSGPVSRVLAERYTARLRARARWIRLTATIVVTMSVLALAGYVVVWHTSLFGVRAIQVRGERVLSASAISAAADIRRGTPVEALDVAAVSRRIGGLPRVATVRVTRRFPHTVLVTVTERQPAALLPVTGGSGGYRVVDADDVCFETVQRALPGVPVLTVTPNPATRDAGAAASLVRGALAAVRALPAGLRSRLVDIQASDPFAITLQLTGHVTVDWGGVDQPALKAEALVALMRQPGAHYDVSVPSDPALSG